MKSIAFAFLLALAPAAAHAETPLAFVDVGRIYTESTEAQRIAADVQADADKKQRELTAAGNAITSLKECQGPNAQAAPACQKTARPLAEKYNALSKMNEADLAKHKKEAWDVFRKRLSDVTAKLEAERHVKVLGATPLVADKRDLTDELVKRLNDSDVVALAAKVAALEAEKKAAPQVVPPAAPAAK